VNEAVSRWCVHIDKALDDDDDNSVLLS